MAEIIKMPKMSDTMTEGVIVSWNFKVGDTLKPGDILADVETDKATMEMENYSKGVLLHLAVEAGKPIPVDSVIAIVGKSGEDISSLLQNAGGEATTKKDDTSIPETKENTVKIDTIEQTTISNNNRIKASPLAKKLAGEKGINLSSITGSGDGGRIIKKDIDAAKPTSEISKNTSIASSESYTEINVSQMRKTIANRLAESKFSAPHFYLTMEINMDSVLKSRAEINEYSEIKISVNDIIVKASSIALKKHPKINSSWLDTKIRYNNHINIGVAMAVDEGLLVPVVRYADTKTLSQISAEIKEYNAKAKDKKLQPTDWSGNTFTISNLGMFGIEEFTAIINPPDACILAVGGVKEGVGVVNGEIKIINTMKVTLSCDHRVVDGVVGSQFLQTLKELLECPVKLLV